MEICDCCGNEHDDKFTYVNATFDVRLNPCGRCMDLLVNHEWDKLTELLEEKKKNE